MLNNLIKLLSDTNRLKLDGIEYNKSIPIEDNSELNELELELREVVARANTANEKRIIFMFKSQFEPRISNRLANKCLRYFPKVDHNHVSDNKVNASEMLSLESNCYYFSIYDMPYDIPDDIKHLYIDMDEEEYRKEIIEHVECYSPCF